MFIKTITKTDKKTGNRYHYYRLCEGYRIGESVRHRTIVSMGRLEGIESKEDKKLLADLIERKIKGEHVLFSFDVNPEVEKQASVFAKRIIDEQLIDIKSPKSLQDEQTLPPDYKDIDINSLEHEQIRELGGEWLCKQTLDKLKLGDFIENTLGFSAAERRMAEMHLISRAVYPASDYRTAQWIRENSSVSELCGVAVDKVKYKQLYQISRLLYSKKTALEDYLSSKTNELFDIEDRILFYDLTNTYFEGNKINSKIAKYGPSKEKRSDAKITALAAVVNAQGFLKYSRIYQGNIGDSKTLKKTVETLGEKTSSINRKPVVVMDAGIMSDENAAMLRSEGYDYIAVSRSKLKHYRAIDPNGATIRIFDKKNQPIDLKYVDKKGYDDNYLYVRSRQKAKKEASMNQQFEQRFLEEMETARAALSKRGGTKKYAKVCERIGRVKERYPSANKFYTIDVIADENNDKVKDITWKKKQTKPRTDDGVYFIRTSLSGKDEHTIWTIYNTLTEIEATFRVLKTDLSLRPVYHQSDKNIEAHLFLGLLAYQLVATIRHQLKNKGIMDSWQSIVRKMSTQKEVTTIMRNKKNRVIRVKKCSTPNANTRQIYDALRLKHQPYFQKKSVVPDK